MEGGGEDMLLFHQHRMIVALRQHFYSGPHAFNAWSADEDHLQRCPVEFAWRSDDGAVDLTSVGVALDGNVESA